MLRLHYVALLAAIGCSPVSDNSNVPDAPIDSTDMRPPEIASSTPGNMTTKVSVLSPISVFFDEQLDPATVTAATVKLGYNQALITPYFLTFDIIRSHGPMSAGLTQVKGTVSYDPALRKVSFVPAAPLPYGTAFVLAFDVKDKGGVAFTGNLTFMTYVNAQTKEYQYNSVTGVPVQSYLQPVDMNGRMTKRVGSNTPGTDTIWFTADDPRFQRYDFNYSPDGRIQDERQLSPGTDAKYDTPDDVISICVRYTYNAERQSLERTYANAVGPDAMWCTPDDAVVVNSVYQYMGPTLVGWVYNYNAGSDNTWHNSDDKCSIWWDYQYDAQGNKTREINRNCGTDGFSKTPDDTFSYYYDYEYDAFGAVTKFIYHSNAGSDTIWLNGDDTPLYVDRYIRDADGQITEQIHSTGAGPDTMWGTNDDPGTRTVTTYNANKQPEELTSYSAIGGDNMWGTPDDVISSYSKLSYDGLGNRIDQKTYNAGGDAMWKTPDDRVTNDYDFDLAH
jgi:hypothetical protein